MLTSKRWRRTDLLLAFGPGTLANRPEGWVFVTTCALALLLVFLADSRLGGHGTVGALGFIPVVVAGWLLSRTQAGVVAVIAVGLRVLAMTDGNVPVITGVTHVLTIPVLMILAQLAAASVVRALRVERQLEQMSALEGAKSEFLRLASHELRGPVGVVRGYVSMLEDGSLGELPQRALGVLPILNSRIKSMGLMVDLMLETARLDDARLQLQVQRTDLARLVSECVEEMRPLAGSEHPLQLQAPGEPLMARADGPRIATIVNNLIDNAIKYSPDGGQVCCRVGAEGGRAVIAVSDQGIGIAPEQIDKLFGRYSRVVDRGAAIPGTGLGLYVSRELARLHGGRLDVESTPGEGSTFTLELPIAE
jgi:signal transduction histidine kinase